MSAARLAILMTLLFATGCYKTVRIPNPNQGAPPVITIQAFVPGAACDIQANTSVTSRVPVPRGCQFTLGGVANSPGGVKSLNLTIWQNSKVLYQVSNTNTPDTSGNVPTGISIPGTNGSGGIGPNPMLVTVSEGVNLSQNTSPVLVEATSTNFNNMSTSIAVTYGGITCRNPHPECLYCEYQVSCSNKPTPPGCYWAPCTK